MNDKYLNALERFKTYFSFARYVNDSYGECLTYTIRSLSEFLDIPLVVLRNDMIQLNKIQNPEISFAPELIYDNDLLLDLSNTLFGKTPSTADPDDILENIEECIIDSDKTDEMIIKGFLDDVPFTIIDNGRKYDPSALECIEVPMSIDEYLAYNNLFEQDELPKRASNERSDISSVLRNKKYICEFRPEILEILDALETEIKNNGCVRFEYQPVGLQTSKIIQTKPLKIGFDSTENRYVLISCTDNQINTYDLEYISTIKHSKEIKAEFSQELFKYADKVWGFEYNKCFDTNGNLLKPLRAKVLFYNEGNVINKVQRELVFRTPVSMKTDKEGNLIYIDDVYGKESFLNWVCSYGSSAMILEPKSLIDDILKRLS